MAEPRTPRERLRRLYLRLARETERLDHPAPGDLKEAVLARCRALHVDTTDVSALDDALTIVLHEQRVVRPVGRRVEPPPPPRPFSHDEAIVFLHRLTILRMGLRTMPIKLMPAPAGLGQGVAAIRARDAAWLARQRCPACQHVGGAIVSRAAAGSLCCAACQHRWPLTVPR